MDDASRALWLEHLERVLVLSERREHELDAADRLEIARELGITDEDLAAARTAAADHLTRGQGYLGEGMWDSAVDELRHAVALDPDRADAVIALADAHARRYAETGDDADADQARRLARFALQRDPDNADAFALLKRLHVGQRDRGEDRRWLLVGVAAATVLLGGAGALALSAGPSDAPAAPSAPVVPDAPQPPAAPQAPAAPPRPSGPPSVAPTGEGNCPPRMELRAGEGCVAPLVVITPGVGVAGLVVGESTPEDVLATYGEDAQIDRHPGGQVFSINYAYDGDGEYAAGRTANITRPGQFEFRHGKLWRIEFGVYNRAFTTPGGLDTNGSTLDDMLAEFGEYYQLSHGSVLDTYRYGNHGIEFHVNRDTRRVTGFYVIEKSG